MLAGSFTYHYAIIATLFFVCVFRRSTGYLSSAIRSINIFRIALSRVILSDSLGKREKRCPRNRTSLFFTATYSSLKTNVNTKIPTPGVRSFGVANSHVDPLNSPEDWITSIHSTLHTRGWNETSGGCGVDIDGAIMK